MGSSDTAAAELEAVAVTVAVALAELGIAVAECRAVLDGYHTNGAGFRFRIQIPAVIAVVIGHTAIEHIALTAGQLCSKAVGIFHGFIIAVILGGTVENQVIAGPVCNGGSAGVVAGELQTSVLIVVEYHALNGVVAAGEKHAVVGCLGNLKAVEMPVVAVQHDTALGGICLALSGEVKDNIGAVIGLDGLHGVCRTAVGQPSAWKWRW